MSVSTILGNNIEQRTYSSGTENMPWVRNPSWPALPTTAASNKSFSGLYAVWPGTSNFITFSVNSGPAGTINWGDGVTEAITGATQYHQYDYADADLAGTDAPVTLNATADKIERTAHGYVDGNPVQIWNIVSTTGITTGRVYYVVNATANDFQIALTPGGSAVAFTTDGTATLLPYKIATVVVTGDPAFGFNNPALNAKHNQSLLQTYSTGWLDIAIASTTMSGLTIGVSSPVVTFNYLEQLKIFSTSPNLSIVSNLCNGFRALSNVDITINTTSPTTLSMNSMFSNCSNLKTVKLSFPGNSFSAASTTSVFSGCTSLKEAPFFDTSTIQTMSGWFSSCSSLINVPPYDTSSVTNMSTMFQQCRALVNVPVFNTASVTNTSTMFSGCGSLVKAPFFNLSAVTNASNMFQDCVSLLEVPNYVLTSCTNLTSMFTGCSSLVTIPALTIRTASAPTLTTMFQNCVSLQTPPVMDTSAATTFTTMFNGCTALESAPNYNLSSATNISGLFASCTSLQYVPLYSTASVTNFSSVFSNCTSLQVVPAMVSTAATTFASVCNGCTSLREFYLTSATATTASSGYTTMFNNCPSLSRVVMAQMKFTFTVAGCQLSGAALDEIYTNLPTVTGQTITVSNNWGTASDTPSIATAKGWTVVG